MKRVLSCTQQCMLPVIFVFLTMTTGLAKKVSITILESAVAKGAVCLDGSPPAYYLDRGFGTGTNNWLVHVQGGGWCFTPSECLRRSKGSSGSSKLMANTILFDGILNNSISKNPDFYNWNRVLIAYCDGGSFSSDVEEVDPVSNIYYRGSRIFAAVTEDLLEQGMKNAENVLLSGCSAGGLTSVLHCDYFRSLIPQCAKVKCLADAGFFLNTKDISGAPTAEKLFDHVVTTHRLTDNLPDYCTGKMKPGLCFFPQNIVEGIQTPLFIVNTAVDTYQIPTFLAPDSADPLQIWKGCKDILSTCASRFTPFQDCPNCSATEQEALQGFVSQFISTLKGSASTKSYFIGNVITHCQIENFASWSANGAPLLKNKTISEAVADWFHNDTLFQEIDPSYSQADASK